MQIIAKLKGSASGAASLQSLVAPFGHSLAPMHPQTEDPELKNYYIFEVPDSQAVCLLEKLNNSSVIDGAFIKPLDAPP